MPKHIQTIDLATLDTVSGGMSWHRANRLAHHPRYLANHPYLAARVDNRLNGGCHSQFRCGTRC